MSSTQGLQEQQINDGTRRPAGRSALAAGGSPVRGTGLLALIAAGALSLGGTPQPARAQEQADGALGTVTPALEHFERRDLFGNLWQRPELSPRDRSLVTLSALITAAQAAQVPYHLNRAMDNGLTRAEASEAVTHLAFYAGWRNAFSAVPVLKGVFDARRD